LFFDPGTFSSEALIVEANRRDGIRDALFEMQQRCSADMSQFRLLRCSRRSGKTFWAIMDIVLDHWAYPNQEYAYIALTRNSARTIIWPIIKQINREFGLQLRLRESIGRVEFPNGAGLSIYGADRDDWADRIYGQKLRKVFIDEASWFKSNLFYLVEDVCEPCITDLEGQITLMSIPSPHLGCLFHKADTGEVRGWSPHRWTWRDNPHIAKQTLGLIRRKLSFDPQYLQLPSTRRNWLNEWVIESGHLVYKCNYERNALDESPLKFEGLEDWRFVLAIDFGWDHRTAFVILGWHKRDPTLYEFESYAEEEMLLDAMVARVKMYKDQYPRLQIVADPDGKREFGELTRRFGLVIDAAEKSQKHFWINLYNTELSAGRIKVVAPESSPHWAEMLSHPWTSSRSGELVRTQREELVEQKGSANDCCDASLYGFRVVYNFRNRKPSKPPVPGSAEHYELLEREMMLEAEEMGA
jgi:hypothetical protein